MHLKLNNLKLNSKEVSPGDVFFAIKGASFNGNDFIEDARSRGASLIITEDKTKHAENVIIVDNVLLTLSEYANNLAQPQPSNIVAVTGTNGKTSVVHFVRSMLEEMEVKAASIGTIGVVCGDKSTISCLTTPDAITLNKTLYELKKSHIENVAIEASSHGLVQHRLDFINFKAVSFTNITRDHLDFHLTMENYLNAKMKIFNLVAKGGFAIINADMQEYNYIKEQAKHLNIIDYGYNAEYIKIIKVNPIGATQLVKFKVQNELYEVRLGLIGEFQVTNIMNALGLLIALGYDKNNLIYTLARLQPPKGRLEQVGKHNIFVDYAHTPDALMKALNEIRKITQNKVILVFGCGGDRDKGKRSLMGEVASQYADIIIVTDDNPRTEDPASIRASILQTCKSAIEIGDRGHSIKYAVSIMKEGDTLLIAGKGHEKYQQIGAEKIEFDDVLEAWAAATS